MAFRYLKYLTGFTNTIVAESPTPFTLGPGEGQIYTNFEIPAVQPLYLYAESGGNVIVNSDSAINAYLAYIGEEPFENVFTGYTASTETRLSGLESDVVYLSGQTALKLNTSAFNIYSGQTQTQINNKLNTSAFNVYSAATLTNINSRLLKTDFNTYSGTTVPATYLKISNFNTYSGATQVQINNKLSTSAFNVYSAETLTLIQSSQAGLDPKESVFLATVAPLGTGATYNATGGTAGTGRFTGAPTSVDGRALSNGKRVLVKNQTDARQNGIYTVISSGVWNRSSDMDGSPSSEVSAGNYAFVETGSTNIGSGWVVIGNGQLTLNVDNIVWTQFNAATGYVAGVGIVITGNTISFNGASVAGNALSWSGTQLNVNPTGGTLGTKFNTKLDITDFNVYSAATLTNINSRLLKTDFNTYTGTTAPATYLTKTAFNVYSAATQTTINNKLDKTVFNTFTGTTAPATYLSISNFNVYSAATLTNIQSRLLTSAFNTYSANTANLINTKIGSANNGLTKAGTNVHLGGALTGATQIGMGANSITFTATTGTLKYGSDLSANYTPRSIIDQGYFTGHTLHTQSQLLIYSSGSTNLNVTTPTSISFNVAAVRNDTAVFTSTGGTTIKILVAGTYDVSFCINVTSSSGTNKSIGANIYKNGSIVDQTLSAAAFTTSSAGMAIVLPPTQLTFAVNDVITVRGYRLITATGNATTVPNSVFLSIVKKY